MITKRISYLDGLRGVAILYVVFFHAYSYWGAVETFDQSKLLRIFFSYGFFGVYLFFSISGYVIYMSMSLNKSSNMLTFGFSRYLRLAPLMFVASVLLYLSSFLIPERPIGSANLQDFLPSILFMQPGLLTKILSVDIQVLDGSFWSLFVEVKFYFLSAILFFVFKDKELKGLLILYILYLLLMILVKLGIEQSYVLLTKKFLALLGVNYYGWFLLGIYSYKYTHRLSARHIYSVVLIALITIPAQSMMHGGSVAILIASAVTVLLFIAPLFNRDLRYVLSSKVLLFFGFVSYPLYLIHQNLVTGLAIKLHNSGLELPSFVYPLPFIVLVILVAFLMAQLEPSIKTLLLKIIPNKIFNISLTRK